MPGSRKTLAAERTAIRARWLTALTELSELPENAVVRSELPEKSPLSAPSRAKPQWDDEKAAHQHRLDQARGLIRSVTVQIEFREHVLSAPRYVHDTRAEGQGYVELASVRSDVDRARDLVRRELAAVRGALRRANAVAAVLDLQDEIDNLVHETESLDSQLVAE